MRDLHIHCPALREVTLVAEDPKCKRYPRSNRDFCTKKFCQTKILIEYEELTHMAKLERIDGWGMYGPTQGMSAREAFESSWKMFTALPCPSVRSVVICAWAKRWDILPAEEVDRFLAARALEELSQLMRWLYLET
jgi:hypothetical protein